MAPRRTGWFTAVVVALLGLAHLHRHREERHEAELWAEIGRSFEP